MAFYVTSNDLGDGIGEFVAMAGGSSARVGAIVNAIDDRAPEVRAAAVDALCTQLGGLGLQPVELDLRRWFGHADAAQALDDVAAVWVRGGNTFLLRAALAQSGLDRVLTTGIAADRIVWGGASAGAIVLGPTLRGVELMNDPSAVAPTYGIDPIWSGLGVLDEVIVPHFRSGHVESDAAEAMAARFAADGTAYRVLRSGEFVRSR